MVIRVGGWSERKERPELHTRGGGKAGKRLEGEAGAAGGMDGQAGTVGLKDNAGAFEV